MFQRSLLIKNPLFSADLAGLVRVLGDRSVRFAVISKKVSQLYPALSRELKKAGIKAVPFDDGEKIKNYAAKQALENLLIESGVETRSVVAVIGGGTLLDLGGFTASTLFRGIKWVAVPTTLLAMVDASVGGKTAINNKYGKNLIGTFHYPEEVAVWAGFLKSLPPKEIQNGLSETMKHGIIKDQSLFYDCVDFEMSSVAATETFIKRSQKIKIEVVGRDPLEETGERYILNFGHTVGHAIEKYLNYKISHGSAVSIGLVWESAASHLHGHLNKTDFGIIKESVFKAIPPPKKYPSVKEIWKAAHHDKKNLKAAVRYVPVKEIGSAALCPPFLQEIDQKVFEKSFSMLK